MSQQNITTLGFDISKAIEDLTKLEVKFNSMTKEMETKGGKINLSGFSSAELGQLKTFLAQAQKMEMESVSLTAKQKSKIAQDSIMATNKANIDMAQKAINSSVEVEAKKKVAANKTEMYIRKLSADTENYNARIRVKGADERVTAEAKANAKILMNSKKMEDNIQAHAQKTSKTTEALKVREANKTQEIIRRNAAKTQMQTGATKETGLAHGISKLGSLSSVYATYRGLNALQQAALSTAKNIKEVELRMAEINRVMDSGQISIKAYRDQIIGIAKDYGREFDETSDITLRFAKAGYDAQDSIKMTEQALLALNTAELDAKNATESLIGILAQWKMDSDDLGTVIDKINKNADKFTLDSQDLVDALLRTSSAGRLAGMSFDEMVASVVAAETAVQRGGKYIGTSLNSIIAQMKAPQRISLMESLGIDIFADEAKTTFKSATEIFYLLSDAMAKLEAEGKGASVEMDDLLNIFTIFRRNVGSGMLGEMDTFNQSLKVSASSAGYSAKENDIYMNTLEALQKQVKTTNLEMQMAVSDNGGYALLENSYKALIAGAEGMTFAFEKLGVVPVMVGAATLAVTSFSSHFKKMSMDSNAYIISMIKQMSNLSNTAKTMSNVKFDMTDKKVFPNFDLSTKRLVAYNKAVDAKKFKEADMVRMTQRATTVEQKYYASLKGTSATLTGLTGAYKAAALQTTLLTIGTIALSTAISVGLTFGIGILISQLGKVAEKYKEARKETDALIEQSKQLKENYEGSVKAIEDDVTAKQGEIQVNKQLASDLEMLASKSNKTAGEQAYMEEIVKRLNEAYPQLGLSVDNLSNAFGNQSNSISSVIGDMEKAIESEARYNVAVQATTSLMKARQTQQQILARMGELEASGKAYGYSQKDGIRYMTNEYSDLQKQLEFNEEQMLDFESAVEVANEEMARAEAEAKGMADSLKNVGDEQQKVTNYLKDYIAATQTAERSAETFDKIGSAIEELKNSLKSGITETDQFYTAISLLFGETPPIELEKSLETVQDLFATGEDSAAKMFSVISQYTKDGEIDFKTLQTSIGLTDEAMAGLTDKLQEMGLMLSDTVSLDTLGNGLGLSTEQAVKLENQLKSLYAEFKNTGNTEAANRQFEEIVKGFGLAEGAAEDLRRNWKYMLEGLNEDTLTAFMGIGGKTAEMLKDVASDSIDVFKEALSEQLEAGTDIGELKLDGLVNLDEFEKTIKTRLEQTGDYTQLEIDEMARKLSQNVITIKMDAIVQTLVEQVDVPESEKENAKEAIMKSFSADSMSFDINTAIDAIIETLNLSDTEKSKVRESIQDSIDQETMQIDLSNLEINLKDIGLEQTLSVIKPVVDGLNNINNSTTANIRQEEEELKNRLEEAEAKAKSLVSSLENVDKQKTTKVSGEMGRLSTKVSDVSTKARSLQTILRNISNMKITPTVTMPNIPSGGSKVNTSNIPKGKPVFAKGGISLNGGEAIVGDGDNDRNGDSRELIISKDGKTKLVGKYGPELVRLKPSDMVLPDDVTSKVLKGQIPMYATGRLPELPKVPPTSSVSKPVTSTSTPKPTSTTTISSGNKSLELQYMSEQQALAMLNLELERNTLLMENETDSEKARLLNERLALLEKQKQVYAQLNEQQKKSVASMGKGSESWNKLSQDIATTTNDILNAEIAIQEVIRSIHELNMQKIQLQLDDITIELDTSELQEGLAMGGDEQEVVITNRIEIYKRQGKLLQDQLREQERMLSTIKQGTVEWKQQSQEVQRTKNSIMQVTQTISNINYDRITQSIERINSLGILSTKQQIANIQKVLSVDTLTYNQRIKFQQDYYNLLIEQANANEQYRQNQLQAEFAAAEKITAKKKEELNKQLEELRASWKKEDNARNRKYHQMRTGEEHRLALEEMDREESRERQEQDIMDQIEEWENRLQEAIDNENIDVFKKALNQGELREFANVYSKEMKKIDDEMARGLEIKTAAMMEAFNMSIDEAMAELAALISEMGGMDLSGNYGGGTGGYGSSSGAYTGTDKKGNDYYISSSGSGSTDKVKPNTTIDTGGKKIKNITTNPDGSLNIEYYYKGRKGINREEVAMVGDRGRELVMLGKSDSVIPNPQVQQIERFAQNPQGYIREAMYDKPKYRMKNDIPEILEKNSNTVYNDNKNTYDYSMNNSNNKQIGNAVNIEQVNVNDKADMKAFSTELAQKVARLVR